MPEENRPFSLEELQRFFLASPPVNLPASPRQLDAFPPAPIRHPADPLPGADELAHEMSAQAPGCFDFAAGATPDLMEYGQIPTAEPSAAYTNNILYTNEPTPVSKHGFLRFMMCMGIVLCIAVLGASFSLDNRIAPQSFFGLATYMTVNLDEPGSLPQGTLYILETNAVLYQLGDTVLLSDAHSQNSGATRVIASVSIGSADGNTYYNLEGDGYPNSVRGSDIYGRVTRTIPKAGFAVHLLAKYRPWFLFFGVIMLLILIISRLSLRTKPDKQ
ncbi:MAG: hypothetical protein LBJ12_05105 [Oscillospiraceae bacterium]|nr:hypothetical protein [Oscillospiraceae bacterium]